MERTLTKILLGATGLVFLMINGCAPKYGRHFGPSTDYYSAAKKASSAEKNSSSQNMDETLKQKPVLSMPSAEPIDAKELVVSSDNEVVMDKITNLERLAKTHREKIEKIDAAPISSKAKKLEKRKVQKQAKREIRKQLKEDIKELKETEDGDQYVLMMILAFLIPPLGVGLVYGITTEFWLSLVLTLLFWLPGAIYGLIKVNEYYKG